MASRAYPDRGPRPVDDDPDLSAAIADRWPADPSGYQVPLPLDEKEGCFGEA